MRLFITFSEFCGPVPCEHKRCRNHAFTVVLTDAENNSLPEESGPEAVKSVFLKGLGKAVCDECLKDFEPMEV